MGDRTNSLRGFQETYGIVPFVFDEWAALHMVRTSSHGPAHPLPVRFSDDRFTTKVLVRFFLSARHQISGYLSIITIGKNVARWVLDQFREEHDVQVQASETALNS